MNGNYTKHIYIGSQRIVSKLGDLDSYGPDPRRIEYAGANVDGAKVDYANKYTALQQTIKDRYAAFEVPYYGKDNDDYVNGQGFCCDDSKLLKSFAANDNPELFQYYYHSDHLGSSSLITNLDGEVVQHIEYVPFGEVFIEERNNVWNTPYLFNAKELDEETGLYYYGARYYDPRVSIWISTDPLQEKYPNVSTYMYCSLNPVKYIDPDGMDDYYKENGIYLGKDDAKTNRVNIVRNDVKSSKGGAVILDSDIITTLKDEKGNYLDANTFLYLASTLYGEGASTRDEAAAIMSVLKNRAKEDGTSIVDQCDPAYPKGVRGARQSERDKYFMKIASNKMKQAANGGVIDAFTTNTDYSNGGFWWDGKDFDKNAKGNTSGNAARYAPGYHFTNSAHDLWKQGNNPKSGVGKMNRSYEYKYESTNAIGRTTFSRLTDDYKNSLFINSDGSIRPSNWSGNKPK